eukprot:14774893-Ditylum_brightwellii.AAC.1
MSTPNELEKCETCLTCKIRKSNRGKGNTREESTEIGQDYHLDAMWTVCTANKCPPLAWLNKLLTNWFQVSTVQTVTQM